MSEINPILTDKLIGGEFECSKCGFKPRMDFPCPKCRTPMKHLLAPSTHNNILSILKENPKAECKIMLGKDDNGNVILLYEIVGIEKKPDENEGKTQCEWCTLFFKGLQQHQRTCKKKPEPEKKEEKVDPEGPHVTIRDEISGTSITVSKNDYEKMKKEGELDGKVNTDT